MVQLVLLHILFYFEAEEFNKCLVIKLTAILFDYNIVQMTADNRKQTPDPQLSNLQHAVGYFKYGVFQIKNKS